MLTVLTVVLLGGLTLNAQQFRFDPTPDNVVWGRLERYQGKDADRERTLKAMFAEAGCKPEELTEDPVKHASAPNILCVVRGKSDREIVVGAHFDYVYEGKGVVDNWSGASMLPSLLETVEKESRQHAYIFIGFTDEEQGLVGSHSYVQHLSKEQRQNISAMINLDTLGLGPTEVWVSHADRGLVKALSAVAQATKLPISGMNVDNVGESDSESFRDRKIPSMTIHSVTQKTLPILHSSEDTITEINRDDYLQTYRLMAGYVVYLDQYLDSATQNLPVPK
ncbi:MAG TPA: M28 family peptidase [Terriglobales bacterium]|nr:M28 family peptidase [Terriglobales bacterium]